MKIRESKNLKYDEIPVGHFEDPEKVDPSQCILDRFHVVDEKLKLEFKNGRSAIIRAQNYEGSLELSAIEKNLNEFVGKSYAEILDADFQL